jgi:thioesterase domain-containing protein/aryl carrier-like protein
MMPAVFVPLAAMPLNANGKVDRKALPAPEKPSAASGYVAPRTREEEILAAVWAQALRLPRVGVNDNFFELGGDSILSVQIVARARQAGLLFTTRQVFEHQTLAELARHAKATDAERLATAHAGAQSSGAPWSPLVPIQPLGTRMPLFCVHPIGGEVLCYYQLARQLGTDQPVYGLQASPLDGEDEAPQVTIEETAAEYVDAVRSFQPAGPYLLAGYSFGGVVAFEMARQLTGAGEEVALLAILDQPVSPGDETAEVDTAAVIADMVRHHTRAQGPAPDLHAETLRGLPLEVQLALGLEILGSLEALGPGFDIPMLRDLVLGWSARETAVERYRVAAYPGRITLLRASSVDPAALRELTPQRRQVFKDPTLGWDAVAAGGVDVYTVPGSHQTMIEAPHVETLAEVLRACIARAERGLGRTASPMGPASRSEEVMTSQSRVES